MCKCSSPGIMLCTNQIQMKTRKFSGSQIYGVPIWTLAFPAFALLKCKLQGSKTQDLDLCKPETSLKGLEKIFLKPKMIKFVIYYCILNVKHKKKWTLTQ